MQGFIISIHRAKEEDTIVSILTLENVYTLYRFYGARHSTINLGYKIDFEIDTNQKSSIDRLKEVLHLGYDWLRDMNRLRIWQEFTALFWRHLKENTHIDSFYFDLLQECTMIWHIQNPKRIVIEAYIRLLKFEGRLNTKPYCFLCESPITEDYTLVRAFLPVHTQCGYKDPYSTLALEHLYTHSDCIKLTDEEVSRLYNTILLGF